MKKNKQLTKSQRKLLLTLRTTSAGDAIDLANNFSLIDLETLQRTKWHGIKLPIHDHINDHLDIQKMQTVISAAIAEKNDRLNREKHCRHDRHLVRTLKQRYEEPLLTESEVHAEKQYHLDWLNSLPNVGQFDIEPKNINHAPIAAAA